MKRAAGDPIWRIDMIQSHAFFWRPRVGRSVSMLGGGAINIHWLNRCLKIGWPSRRLTSSTPSRQVPD